MSAERLPDTDAGTGIGTGSVIRLSDHQTARGRQGGGDRPPVAAHDDTPSPELDLAFTAEAMYRARKRTLTDPATEEAFLIAIDTVALVLRGAAAQGVVDDDQHKILSGMLTNMQNTARLL
ncbi:hypothetical protein ACFQ6Q_00220 [Streptomyces sp. NPDC056437]|uniref:hypothetical protein n=1 Tax=Streptomyces sp. NPDC056437 TaxID=3345816 RepID=UPI0036743F25